MKYFIKILLPLIIALFLISSSGCDDTITVNDLDNKVIPESDVSFSEHIYPVLQVKCATSGCHNGPNSQGGIDLSTWAGTTADPNVVFPGYPDNSSLVWTIEGLAGFPPMPPIGYRPLTLNQIQGIRTWITEGARNN